MFRCIVTYLHAQCTVITPWRVQKYSRSPQIVHSQNRAYDVPPHYVKHKDLPYCAVRRRVRRLGIVVILHIDVGDGSIEVQYAFYASYTSRLVMLAVRNTASTYLLVPQRDGHGDVRMLAPAFLQATS